MVEQSDAPDTVVVGLRLWRRQGLEQRLEGTVGHAEVVQPAAVHELVAGARDGSWLDIANVKPAAGGRCSRRLISSIVGPVYVRRHPLRIR